MLVDLGGGEPARNVSHNRLQLHRSSITFLPGPPSPEPAEDFGADIAQSPPQSAPVCLPGKVTSPLGGVGSDGVDSGF